MTTHSPIRTVEQVICPTCETRLGMTDYTRVDSEHKTLHTMQRTMETNCPHCGDRFRAQLLLNGGVWELQTLCRIDLKKRKSA